MNGKTIYTHDIAAGIADRFEDVLAEKLKSAYDSNTP